MNTSIDHQRGFNQAADDYGNKKLRDVTAKSEDYQEGYHAGWEHNAELNPSEPDKPDLPELKCENCMDGHFRPCHFCGS
jgi:hypothetical protein